MKDTVEDELVSLSCKVMGLLEAPKPVSSRRFAEAESGEASERHGQADRAAADHSVFVAGH